MTVFETIAAQQKGKENTAPWMVGEQLAAICRADPACAELVQKDLENKDMSLEAAEKKIKEYADKNHGHSWCFCVPPNVAEQIIRDFYGLPAADAAPIQMQEAATPAPAKPEPATDMLDLASFF